MVEMMNSVMVEINNVTVEMVNSFTNERIEISDMMIQKQLVCLCYALVFA